MKKSILLFAGLILFGLNAIAQDTYNIIIFSEEGDGFYAIVNGIRQNDKPETNVKITGLTAEALSLRVEFENKALPKLKQNMMGEAGFEHTIRIKTTMKKELKLQYFGKVALADAPKSSGSTVAYHTSENSAGSTGATQYNTSGNDGGGNTTITTTSTTTKVNSNPNNVSLNVGAGGAGVSINIDGMDATGGSMQSTSSTTVTKTTSSSSSSSSSSTGGGVTKNTQQVNTTASGTGCSTAMNSASYEKMKQSVESKPFSETKMSTAKVATKNACLSSAQIKGICGLFAMDDDKLTYAKYAYNYCTDKANYYQVSEIFSFSGTTEELNKFLEQN